MIYDFHMHSSISNDSITPMEEMVKSAIEKKLDGICLTQHHDLVFPGKVPWKIDFPKYREEYNYVKEKYKDKIEIYYGIEAGLHKTILNELNDLIDEHKDLDFVLASFHSTDNEILGEPEYYANSDKHQRKLEYLNLHINNLKKFDNFDCVAHIGFISKFAPEPGWELLYADYKDLFDEILKMLISHGKGIEVNTSSLKRCPYTMVEFGVLKRYKELGGEILTIGGDAHEPTSVGYSFEKALAGIKECGFNYLTKFQNRKPVFYKI